MPRTIGYWLSQDGSVPVTQDHIDAVVAEPERFGLDRDTITEIYRRHGEEIGREGFARDEIMRRAAENGWIRIRVHANSSSFLVVQGFEPEQQIEAIASLLCDLVNRDVIASDEAVVFSNLSDTSTKTVKSVDGGVSAVINNGCVDI
jgi:hypothetical protein